MLLTHHSLGFVLLAFLISPAHAAPTPTRYIAHTVDVNGKPVRVALEAQKHITKSVEAMGEKKMRTPNPKFDASITVYYELYGGFCDPPRKCFGYVVTPAVHNVQQAVFGSLVAGRDGKRVGNIQIPIPFGVSTEPQATADRFFFENFVPIKDWVMGMLPGEAWGGLMIGVLRPSGGSGKSGHPWWKLWNELG
ncbi:hypothetical protein BDP27DRAFT_1322188 [Rhodocollybia butyracea]|uniref:Uncharacterized protein n=1 Tax=Rhodocollybia butyracea TaxID=206335 RepID=A0A9P5PYK3_9AGAR|nr:hypothetical protein BDP27DRAFT_1322188 [Rhodocollybia butyracea]